MTAATAVREANNPISAASVTRMRCRQIGSIESAATRIARYIRIGFFIV